MDPGDGRVVSNFIVQALRGMPLTIYGDGNQTRSFCYVDDLLQGLIAFMDSDPDVTGPINLGNPGEYTMKGLATAILELTGSKSKIVFQELPSDDPVRRCPDISRANAQLGWSPTVALHDGLTKTIAYFDDLLLKDRKR
jgi:UDP-glucuronate decarboxylase